MPSPADNTLVPILKSLSLSMNRQAGERAMSGVLKTKAWMKWIVILVSLPITQNLAAQTVLAPTRQITYEEALQTGNSLPRWEQGYLVSWKMDTSSSNTGENISLYDRDGATVGKTRIWLEGASFLRIEDAAARKDG